MGEKHNHAMKKLKNELIFVALMGFYLSASASDTSEAEKRRSFYANCMKNSVAGLMVSDEYKKYASTPFVLEAMSSCYCGRVASKYQDKDAVDMIEKLQRKEKLTEKPKMLELYENSELACKKALFN